jgi:hypothetical protein
MRHATDEEGTVAKQDRTNAPLRKSCERRFEIAVGSCIRNNELRARNGDSTAPFAPQSQFFLDHLVAGFGPNGPPTMPASRSVGRTIASTARAAGRRCGFTRMFGDGVR